MFVHMSPEISGLSFRKLSELKPNHPVHAGLLVFSSEASGRMLFGKLISISSVHRNAAHRGIYNSSASNILNQAQYFMDRI